MRTTVGTIRQLIRKQLIIENMDADWLNALVDAVIDAHDKDVDAETIKKNAMQLVAQKTAAKKSADIKLPPMHPKMKASSDKEQGKNQFFDISSMMQ